MGRLCVMAGIKVLPILLLLLTCVLVSKAVNMDEKAAQSETVLLDEPFNTATSDPHLRWLNPPAARTQLTSANEVTSLAGSLWAAFCARPISVD